MRKRNLIAGFGVTLVVLFLLRPILRLSPVAIEALQGAPSLFVLSAFAFSVVFNLYAEGYRGFHLRFSPRVVGRAFYLGDHPTLVRVLLALPFCLSLVYATRRQITARLILIGGIALLVWLVHHVPQPWRGVIDAGVVSGLGFGLGSVIYHFVVGLGRPTPTPSDLPTNMR